MEYPGYEVEDFYKLNPNNNNMDNGMFKLTAINLNSALVYGLLSVALYVIKLGDVFIIDWHVAVNIFFMAMLASLVKNMFTTNQGNFAGVVPVIPETK